MSWHVAQANRTVRASEYDPEGNTWRNSMNCPDFPTDSLREYTPAFGYNSA
uniref:Uncharacterized protein n=1 Tax=Moniliophthora roreri TaxID=221103 RepID=A0A0W0G204_MONRR